MYNTDVTTTNIDHLTQIRLFDGLSDDDLAAVARAAWNRSVNAGSFFFYQGDPARHMYVLTAGRVRLSQVTPEGHQVIMRFIGPGEGFAIIAALSHMKYPVSAEAVERSEALYWDGATIAHLIEEHCPHLGVNAMNLLASRVREFQDRIRELSTERVERRIARTLLRLARQAGRKVEGGVLLDLPLSRQDLAEMAGTTIYTVSRTLSSWEQNGLIETGRERVLIRSPHDLVVIAEDLPTDHDDT